jgi:glutamate--cysteine ligase
MNTTAADFNISEYLQNSCSSVETWFRQQWRQYTPPIYGSIDIRNAGFKLAPVDTNLFPAGFNNLKTEDMPLYVQAMQATIAELGLDITHVLLIPESHTRNPFYFESVGVLHEILIQSGLEVRIGTLNPEITQTQEQSLHSGKKLMIEPLVRQGHQVTVKDFNTCCILLNNDLSSGVPDILNNITQTILPPVQLGWTTRLKSEHFGHYQVICQQFAENLQIDPWLMMPYFDQCPDVDFNNSEGQECLMNRAQLLLARIKEKYAQYQINQTPFLVVKADQGTYGMAVMMIDDPEQLRHLNRKQRQKMSVIKGGQPVTKAIIQEGVHTFETAGPSQSVAEPVIYTIGRHVIGGFYRLHKERGPRENLNSPGMDFAPLLLENYCHLAKDVKACSRFYAYGVIARLALLASARELTRAKDEAVHD